MSTSHAGQELTSDPGASDRERALGGVPSSFRPRTITGPSGHPARVHESSVLIVTPIGLSRMQAFRLVRSLSRQSLQAWGWVIPFGCHPDVLPEDARIRMLDEDGSEPSVARILSLIEASTATYIAFLDPRDDLDPTTLERWAWCLDSTPAIPWVRSRSRVGDGMAAVEPPALRSCLEFMADPDRSTSCMIRRDLVLSAWGVVDRTSLDDQVESLWLRLAESDGWGFEIDSLDLATEPWTHEQRPVALSTRDELARRCRQTLDPATWQALGDPAPVVNFTARLPDEATLSNPISTRSRRLLLVIPFVRPGGSEKVILDMLGAMASRGWHVTVAVTGTSVTDWGPRFRVLTDDFLHLDRFLTPQSVDLSMWADFPRFLRYLVESRDPQAILLCNSPIGFGCAPWLREAAPDVAMLGIHHAPYWPPFACEFAHELDGLLVSFRGLADEFVANGVPADRVHHFYTGVDTEVWHPDPALREEVRQELGTPADTRSLLFVGRWSVDKRPALVVDVATRLRERGHPVEAWIVGDGPEREQVRAAAIAARDSVSVRILGSITDGELTRLMPAADVMLLPSQHEGIAVTAFEALACGIPFVGADVGGQRELVTPDCGILVRPSTAEQETAEYVDAIDALFQDGDRLRRMGAAGRQRVLEGFSIEAMADRVEEVIARASRDMQLAPRTGSHSGRLAAALAVTAHGYERHLDWFREQTASLESALAAEVAASREIEAARDWHAGQSALWEAQATALQTPPKAPLLERIRRRI
jgi:glycosyltransferase involved in cell wall biosynthesis